MSGTNRLPVSNVSIAPNPNIPAIDVPQNDLASVRTVLTQIREGVMSAAGQSGGPYDRLVTIADMLALGLVSEPQLRNELPPTTLSAAPGRHRTPPGKVRGQR
jgi:hypothetical protein